MRTNEVMFMMEQFRASVIEFFEILKNLLVNEMNLIVGVFFIILIVVGVSTFIKKHQHTNFHMHPGR